MRVGASNPSPTTLTRAGAPASAYSSWKMTCWESGRSRPPSEPGQPRQVQFAAASVRSQASRSSNASCSRPGPPTSTSAGGKCAVSHSRTCCRNSSSCIGSPYQALACLEERVNLTIPAALARAATEFGTGPAVTEPGGVRLNWIELHSLVRRAASAFAAQDIRPHDRVAIWAPNSADWVVAAMGALYAGATLVPVNTRFTAPEAQDVISRSGAKALVVI